MKLTVQVVLHADDDTETVVRDVFTVQREQPLAPDTLGLGLGEAKDVLAAVQDTLVENQVAAALSTQVGCPECGLPRRHKDSRPIVMRTLFGRLRLDSPRWWHCGCSPQAALTFSPLASILPERTTPELSYLQARFAGLVSYGLSADLLGELLPLGRALHANTVCRQVQATAQRLRRGIARTDRGALPPGVGALRRHDRHAGAGRDRPRAVVAGRSQRGNAAPDPSTRDRRDSSTRRARRHRPGDHRWGRRDGGGQRKHGTRRGRGWGGAQLEHPAR